MMLWRCRENSRRSRNIGPAVSRAAATASIGANEVGRVDEGVHEQFLQRARPNEQHLALVGEVPEERPLGEAGPLGDVRHRRLLEPALAVELHGRPSKPPACVWLPSDHEPIVVDDSN